MTGMRSHTDRRRVLGQSEGLYDRGPRHRPGKNIRVERRSVIACSRSYMVVMSSLLWVTRSLLSPS